MTIPTPDWNDALPSRIAKAKISTLVKMAMMGERRGVISRGAPVAVIGPLTDLPGEQWRSHEHVPASDIKSGRLAIPAMAGRRAVHVLTKSGRPAALLYRPLETTAHCNDVAVELTQKIEALRREHQRLHGILKELIEVADDATVGLADQDPGRVNRVKNHVEELRVALHRCASPW